MTVIRGIVWVFKMTRLTLDFFNRPTEIVAKELIGQKIMIHHQEAMITETEAYRGLDDPASHAFKGPTPRSRIMFEESGHLYIYLIYGMYHCLNIVAHEDGEAGAVLIRGLQIDNLHLDGPGKICRHFKIDITYNELSLIQSETFYLKKHILPTNIQATPRIGIKQGTDKLWRFVKR
ncbi:MAG: DNA-3-methyladenine glycosylase [Pseudomonadota bacterium]|nr:DNA-3-methyladenine glycosylase [Pseudomonadota bacterium]